MAADSDAGDAHKPRIARRYKVFEATRLIDGDDERRVHLLNISETGALVHGAAPALASLVKIGIGGEDQPARIVWVDGDRFGVVFAQRLDADRLVRLMGG